MHRVNHYRITTIIYAEYQLSAHNLLTEHKGVSW